MKKELKEVYRVVTFRDIAREELAKLLLIGENEPLNIVEFDTNRTLQASQKSPITCSHKSFTEALTGDKKQDEVNKRMKLLKTPRLEGSNIVIELDMEDYGKGV